MTKLDLILEVRGNVVISLGTKLCFQDMLIWIGRLVVKMTEGMIVLMRT